MKEEKKGRKFILYIIIIIFIASLVTLAYRIGSTLIENYESVKHYQALKAKQVEDKTRKALEAQQNIIDEETKQSEIDSFNREFETWVGTETHTGASYQLDKVIKNNKKNKTHLIEVIFDGTSYGTDPDSIKSIKDKIITWTVDNNLQYYEISVDYDESGYIYRTTIETR
jgi:hypothetical protein